jgi:hypothetical protein
VPGQTHPISPDDTSADGAETAFQSIWPRFVNDVIHGSPGAATLAASSVLQVVIGSCDGCLVLLPTWDSEEITAAVQTTYPAEVLIEVNNPRNVETIKKKRVAWPLETLVVLEKEGARTNWKIAYLTQFRTTALVLGPTSTASLSTSPNSRSVFAHPFSQLVQAMISARNRGGILTDNMWGMNRPEFHRDSIVSKLVSSTSVV